MNGVVFDNVINSKKYRFILFFIVSFLALHVETLQAQQVDWLGKEIPYFLVNNQDGDSIELDDLEGEIFVLDFWATWCAPCIKSIPAMQEVEAEFKGNSDVKFLYINTLEFGKRDQQFIGKFLKDKGLNIPYLLDRENPSAPALSKSLGITTLPSKMIVSKSGKILYQDNGFSGSQNDFVLKMKSVIEGILKK